MELPLLLDNVGFYITTYGRGVDKQKTFESLPYILREIVTFVIYKEEAKDFNDYNVMIAKCKTGLGYKRQFIIDNAKEKYIFLMDDDCTFAIRKNGKLVKAERSDVKKMFLLLCKWLKSGIAEVGMSFRGLNFTQDKEYIEVQNVYSVYGFNRELFNKIDLKCNHTTFLSDMQITLGFLSKGYKNRVSYKYAVHQTPGSKGGCANYRTKQNQKESVLAVNKLFPKYTEVIRRKSDLDWRDWDLKVKWTKAYNEGYAKRKREELLKKIG